MAERNVGIAVIIASVREGRFGPTVAHWFATVAEHRPDITVDLVDLAGMPVPSGEFAARIDRADGVVVITPEYNHSFPGPLKNAIDSLHAPWQAKPVAFVSYGSVSGGLRAIEQLRPVFAELHAATIRETVSFHGAQARFDADGNPHDADAVNTAAGSLLDQLTWWSHTLREGRELRPYGEPLAPAA